MALQDVAVTAASWLDSHNVDVEVKGDKNVTRRAELLGKKKDMAFLCCLCTKRRQCVF